MKVIQFPNGEAYRYEPMWANSLARDTAKLLTGKAGEDALRAYHRSRLDFMKPGGTITTVCVKPGATSHWLLLVARVTPEGRPYVHDITRLAADLCGHKVNERTGGIPMGGYGYSKGFQLIYDLGRALWPNGTPEPHGTRNGQPDSDGGYALKQA